MSAVSTSMERVLTTLSHQEPDRVPVFLTLTMHGAKELGLSVEEYFSQAKHVVEGQLRMLRKYRHDCLYSVFHAAAEYEAFGGKVLYSEDGPPQAGPPVIRSRSDIFALEVPDIRSTRGLQMGLEATRGLKEAAAGQVPIIGLAVSPFSIPVMLMGFQPYLDLLHEDREGFDRLMAVTRTFCIEWTNAQFAAGVTAVGYFDPLSAADITAPSLFMETGYPIACETLDAFDGPAALHLASGRALDRIDKYVSTGAAALGVSSLEDLAEIKRQCAGRLAVLGNLNGISMTRWTPEQAKEAVKMCIRTAGPGGGFVLSDNHGEIPFQVSEDVLLTVTETVRQCGTYPIQAQSQDEC